MENVQKINKKCIYRQVFKHNYAKDAHTHTHTHTHTETWKPQLNRHTTEDNAYNELVRRHVEYRIPIFSPFTIDTEETTDKRRWKSAAQIAARYVTSKDSSTCSATAMLEDLN